MKKLNRTSFPLKEYPLKAVQFGQGNFLRAFVDYMIDISNEKGLTNIGVGVVKPQNTGSLRDFDEQDNLYTVAIRGQEQGEIVDTRRIISSISQTINPYTDFQDYIKLAQEDAIEFIFSNTTEAGIAFVQEDRLTDQPASSFPGKLTQFLYHRYSFFEGNPEKGLIIFPCELVENNGEILKEMVLDYIALWSLEADFKTWVLEHVIFTNTLVDRIVTGYPKELAEEFFVDLGYKDKLLTVAEPFALWAIESEVDISKRFPLDKAGLPVVFTKDLFPYREQKLRILNGGHIAVALAAYLGGLNIVRECMEDKTTRLFLDTLLKNEIIPTIQLPQEQLIKFSDEVIERFENPFIAHSLLDISLNAVSKWKIRILPSFMGYYKTNGTFPKLLGFSLAALIRFYQSTRQEGAYLLGRRGEEIYSIKDNREVLAFFKEHSGKPLRELGEAVLKNKDFWGEDLSKIPDFLSFIQTQLKQIESLGSKGAMEALL